MRAAADGAGSGVAEKLRLAEYSVNVSFIPVSNSKRLLAGASGYSFKEWKGVFYPGSIKPEAMLAFYAERLPTVEITMAELAAGLGVLNAFVKAGLVKSNGEARRQIAGGGLRVNDAPVADEKAALTPKDVTAGVIKLSLGRKRHVLLKPA